MGRPKKVIKVKEPIRLRERKLANGNLGLYLDIYVKGTRKYESLGLYLIPEEDENDRCVNEATLKQALKIKSERVLGIGHSEEKKEETKVSRCAFCDWMDDYLMQLQSSGRYSEAYCKHVHSTMNIIKAYLVHINRPRILLAATSIPRATSWGILTSTAQKSMPTW